MIITHAWESDLPAILSLERAGFVETEQWSEGSWASELSADDRRVLAARDAHGDLVGVATFGCVAEMADLHRVVVRADARGQGVAAALVRAGIEWSIALGADRMLLEVRPDNSSAVRLYEKLGFVTLARRSDYYGSGVDALVMCRRLVGADEWGLVRA